MARARARNTTIGVYTLAKRVMKFSERDLRSLAFSTSSRIFEAVESPNDLSTRTRMTPERLTQPEMTLSVTEASRGSLSPVSATVFRLVEPSTMVPSRGTLSPGATTMTSPTSTLAGSMRSSLLARSIVAKSGRMSMSSEMDLRLLFSAMVSKSSPTSKKSITKTASANIGSPPGMKAMSKAPIVATAIRKSSSKGSPAMRFSTASLTTSPPATT